MFEVAKWVEMEAGEWKWTTSLTATPITNFKVIIDIDFIASTKAIPMPHLGVVDIMKEASPCMISVACNESGKDKTLSALKLKKGVKRREVTYLAMLKSKDEPDEEAFPPTINGFLKEFKDVMPMELPKRLPPRREVDHAIELDPGATVCDDTLSHGTPRAGGVEEATQRTFGREIHSFVEGTL